MNKFTVCTVCSLLDGDLGMKHCTYCKVCKAWICDDDINNFKRRSNAMAKRLLLTSIVVLCGIFGLLACNNSTVKSLKKTMKAVQKVAGVNSVNLNNAYVIDDTAQLPQTFINTTLSNTVSPGLVVPLAAGSNLQLAYNTVQCGQTLSLAHGVVWNINSWVFTAKNCDDKHWITITTDGSISPEGIRINPSYLTQMAQFQMPSGGAMVQLSADHIRFIGIAWLKPAGSKGMTAFVNETAAHDIIFDRNYVHGNPNEDTARFIGLSNGGVRISLIDSWVDEMHCNAGTGTCTDSQTIAGGGGTLPQGPIKIVNNYLQAAGENIIFGGGAATTTPYDIEIRRNHLDKPLTWNPTNPAFIGQKYVVKNLLELKNAGRVLVEGNLLTGSWGGFSQSGFAIVLTPKNQAGANGTNLCPVCQVTDITIRYNSIAHVAAGFQIANAASDNGGVALDGERYSIHDIVIDDLDPVKYSGAGMFAQVSSGYPGPILKNVNLSHITAFPVNMLLNVGAFPGNGPMVNFKFNNNVFSSGIYPVWSIGGGTTNCASTDIPVSTVNACFNPNVFAGNVISVYVAPGKPNNFPPAKWPANNLFPTTMSDIGFVNYNNGNGGDYHLSQTSPYKGTATDGKDPGADIDLINQYTNGVQ